MVSIRLSVYNLMDSVLKTSATAKNLMRAFAGESQARNRYTFSASVAKKEGLPVIEKVFLGTKALEASFRQAGIRLLPTDGEAAREEQPDVVVIGFDTELTYEKLERACTFIRNGAVFLATHLDINCPVEGGFIPDCGAMCAAIALSTGVQPKYLGKPFKETVDMVLEHTGTEKEAVAFVGDRIYTDVATGVNNGAKGFLVLTGETKAEDVEKSSVKPDAVFESLGEMKGYL